MKKILSLFAIAAMVVAFAACNKKGGNEPDEEYVNFGLPSGTLWKTSNEHNSSNEYGLFSFNEAQSAFGTQVPSKDQWQELIDNCTWEWKETGFEVSGNGQSIFLPGEGFYQTFMERFVEPPTGNYCTSTKDGGNAYFFTFALQKPEISTSNTSDKKSVRLVKAK